LWDVMLCQLVSTHSYWYFRGSVLLRNICNYLPVGTV